MPHAFLLLTRPGQTPGDLGPLPPQVTPVAAPLMEIVPTGAVPDLAGVAGVIFTSANAVRHGGEPAPVPAYCVGAATTRVARATGWHAEQAGTTAEALVARLIAQNPGTPLVHVGGVHRRGAVAERLSAAGLPTAEIDVYDQRLLPLPEAAQAVLKGKTPVIVPLYSPRAAGHFAGMAVSAPLHIVALSPAIMDNASALPARSRRIAPSPDAAAMRGALAATIGRVVTRAAPN